MLANCKEITLEIALNYLADINKNIRQMTNVKKCLNKKIYICHIFSDLVCIFYIAI